MNPSNQPASSVLCVFESSFSSEGVWGRATHCRHPRWWPLTSTTQHPIHCLVKRTQPLVLERKKNRERGRERWLRLFLTFVLVIASNPSGDRKKKSIKQKCTFSCGVEATRVKLSSGHVILMAWLKTHSQQESAQNAHMAAKQEHLSKIC